MDADLGSVAPFKERPQFPVFEQFSARRERCSDSWADAARTESLVAPDEALTRACDQKDRDARENQPNWTRATPSEWLQTQRGTPVSEWK